MTNVVRKRASHLTTDCSSFTAFSDQHTVRVLSSRGGGAGDFPLLFRHLETARREVDAVFASNGLANMVLTPSDVHIREGVDGKYLEAFSNKVLPFGLRAATEATWDHFEGSEKHRGNGNIYEKTAKNLDDPYTIIEEFTKEMHSKNARADIKAVLGIQRRRREEAESENIRLKLIVERQRKVADSMASVLQKRATGLVNECSSFMRQNCVQHPMVHELAFCGDMGDFQELFRQLEAAYHEVDVVFAVNGLVHMVDTPDDVHIREDGEDTYAEAFSNKVLPFGLRDATEAAWDHFKGSEKHLGNGNIYEKTARDLDEPYTIVEEFTKELFSRRSHADIKLKQVIRRYVEPDRDIVVWTKVANNLQSLMRKRASQLTNEYSKEPW
ncbi:uncharacterized protein KRP23_5151 [Phytophthora ramorum]|uniref:uncharacterized protein n=1 Tax=Phytophthora ramorum TaxID=164328 RepID=UPI00309D34F5|nr:hypothetical protein KRP23_5151 [Phytophthora ramorum]